MLPQIITPSIAPLTFLVNNLAQIGQVQVSDLMPLDRSALDAVAVLVVVSGGPAEDSIDEHIESVELAQAGASAMVVPPSPGASDLERYLSDIDAALNDEPREILAPPIESTGRGSGCVWMPEKTGMAAADRPRRSDPVGLAIDAHPGPDNTRDDDRDPAVAVDLATIHSLAPGSSGPRRRTRPGRPAPVGRRRSRAPS